MAKGKDSKSKDKEVVEEQEPKEEEKKLFGRKKEEDEVKNLLEKAKEEPEPKLSGSLIETLYERIDSVIGPKIDTQMFTMVFPPTIVDAKSFSFKTAEKPLRVALAESKLCNKVVPIGTLVQESMKKISGQYIRSLDTRMPKLNERLVPVRANLRNLLNTVITKPYKLPNGEMVKDITLQNLYETLVGFYTAEVRNFDEKVNKIKQTIAKDVKNDGTIPQDEKDDEFENRYLEWYTTSARSYLDSIQARRDAVLSVLSPDEMASFRTVLSAGVAGVFEEAKTVVEEVQRSVPGGGKFYPINLTPSNWSELLASDFSAIDVLEDPSFLKMKINTLSAKLASEEMSFSAMLTGLTRQAGLDMERKKIQDAREALSKARSEFDGFLTEGVKEAVTIYLDLQTGGLFSAGQAILTSQLSTKALSQGFPIDKNGLSRLSDLTKQVAEANQKVATMQADLSRALRTKAEVAASMRDIAPFEDRINNLRSQINSLRAQYETAMEVMKENQKIASNTNSKSDDEPISTGVDNLRVMPAPKNADFPANDLWTSIAMNFESGDFSSEAQKRATGRNFGGGLNLAFLGSYTGDTEKSAGSSANLALSENKGLDLAMKLAKVNIDRPWMDLGVFDEGGDAWLNIAGTGKVISNGSIDIEHWKVNRKSPNFRPEDVEKWKKQANNAMFPSVPIAMILAKDVSIHLKMSSDRRASFKDMCEKTSSNSGGFLIFKAGGSASNSKSQNSAVVKTTSEGVKIMIRAPQVIGYIIEAVPEDTAAMIDDQDYRDLIRFMKSYQEILAGKMDLESDKSTLYSITTSFMEEPVIKE